jgi:hypothetical protein
MTEMRPLNQSPGSALYESDDDRTSAGLAYRRPMTT